ncbi:MAG TPA: NFACT RNA binding domain-containing protein [Lachnospiraceae bacterium]|nr:NFACT RNA binding domain-containing protein [Lachnospiraceae bacterium]
MALDGLVIANVIKELNDKLLGGRINKISQPENDELILLIKNNRDQYRLFLSASASLPLIYITQENKPNPITAPNFCMLLRKHLNSARILSITQPGLERIVDLEIEHLNELGDVCTKHLIIEIMVKHSNIIFCDDKKKIVDSIKHISGLVSSVREVLPGRDYFIPLTQEKGNPLELDYATFRSTVLSKPLEVSKAIYSTLTGISPLIANEICHRASIDGSASTSSISEAEGVHLYRNLERFIEEIRSNEYHPNIIYKDSEPIEFSSTNLTCYENYSSKEFTSISELLELYYSQKNAITRIRQKSVDLRKIVSNAIERSRKKYDLQMKQLKDTEKRDKYKVYGELITAYGYNLEEGAKELKALNYYTNEDVTIPLDPTLAPIDNAKKYFEKYNKLKRTFEALTKFTEETKEELEHLESISASLDIALVEEDLVQLKEELMEYGYMKRKFVGGKTAKKQKITSKPFHYISSDGFHMYVGKNNFQNDELTFKFAIGNDWWFHAKGMAGSHVIVKTNGEELPDRTFEEAGKLAAYYSKARDLKKAEIDYTEKKNVKKPNGAKPGFVVYYTNYSLIIEPDISGIEEVK